LWNSVKTESRRYVEIADSLKDRYRKTPEGTRLPSERALSHEFGVSVVTLRHALSLLEQAGWIRKVAGSGSYVARPTVLMGPSLTSFTEDMKSRGLTPSSLVLRAETLPSNAEISEHLSLRPGSQVFLLERLRYADGEAICHEIGVLPDQYGQLLEGSDLQGSIHATLAERGKTVQKAQRSVRAVIASDRESQLLELPARSPLLEIVDVFSDSFGSPMHYARTRYRFDRYEVRSNLENLSSKKSSFQASVPHRSEEVL
jgi:GntR family transcriptional regulator